MKTFSIVIVFTILFNCALLAKSSTKTMNKQKQIEKIIQLQFELERLNVKFNKKVLELRKLKKETKNLENQFMEIEKENLKEYTY